MTERIMSLGHQHEEYMRKLESVRSNAQQYKSNTRPTTPVGRNEDGSHPMDRTWLSNGSLADWEMEDKWWLSSSCKSFLETRGTSFGRKHVYLIQKKDSPVSNPELSRRKRSKKKSFKEEKQLPSELVATLLDSIPAAVELKVNSNQS